MDSTRLVSIIIPVYKVEKYLPECLESILRQDFGDYEVVLVDDGSPDNSGKICDDYAKRDSRINVIHKVNEGVAVARKTGVINARGEWITFVDSDDTLPDGALKNLTEYASEEFDIITYNFSSGRFKEEVITAEQYRHFISRGGETVGSSPWAKLIRREICLGVEFPRLKKAQDMCANIYMAFYNKKPVRLITKPVYNYRWDNPTSTVHTFRHDMKHMQDIIDVFLRAIPPEDLDKYKADMVKTLSGSLALTCSDFRCNIWQGTDTYRYFEELVSQTNYKLPLLWRIKFSTKSTIVIKAILLIEKCIGKVIRVKNGIERRILK